MSFILDALQKDQVEQQPEALPAGMLPPSGPSPAKRWGLWLLGAALLINAAVVAWYLLSQDSGSSGSRDVAPSVPGAQRELSMAPSSAPPNTRASRGAPNAAPQGEPRTAAQDTRIPKRNPVRKPVAAPPQVSTRPSTRPTTRSSTTATPATGAGRVLSPEQAAQMGIGDDLFNPPDQVADQPSAQPARTAPPAAKPAASSKRAFNAITVAELPTAARNSFPELEFSTHIFADDPSMRAVVVNDKRLTEGEQLGELILRAVTEEGVVFGYRNHLVAVSVVELWAE